MAYLTLAEFTTQRNISNPDDDDLITSLITRAQQAIDSYCHRTFEGTAADRTFDAVRDVEGSTLWVYSAGDLASITSITNGNGDSVAASAYVTEPRNAVAKGKPIIGVTLKSNSTTYWRTATNGVAEDAITVNGVWAYSATVPADIVQATFMMTAYYYDHRMKTGSELTLIPGVSVRIPIGIPTTVKETLAPYIRESF